MVENNNEIYDLSVSLGDFKLDNPVIPASWHPQSVLWSMSDHKENTLPNGIQPHLSKSDISVVFFLTAVDNKTAFYIPLVKL